MTEKKIEITAELREGVSTKTNQPYRFYTYYMIVNGVQVALRPENRTAGALLEWYLDNQK